MLGSTEVAQRLLKTLLVAVASIKLCVMLWKSTFLLKSDLTSNFPLTNNLKKPACASKQDGLPTLWYLRSATLQWQQKSYGSTTLIPTNHAVFAHRQDMMKNNYRLKKAPCCRVERSLKMLL